MYIYKHTNRYICRDKKVDSRASKRVDRVMAFRKVTALQRVGNHDYIRVYVYVCICEDIYMYLYTRMCEDIFVYIMYQHLTLIYIYMSVNKPM